MSSTDEQRLRRFFAERLVPAAETLRRRGVQLFPLGPEPDAESWYVEGPGPERDFVELPEDGLEDALRALFRERGLPELEALAPALMELSGALEIAAEETPDISPFVYVMY